MDLRKSDSSSINLPQVKTSKQVDNKGLTTLQNSGSKTRLNVNEISESNRKKFIRDDLTKKENKLNLKRPLNAFREKKMTSPLEIPKTPKVDLQKVRKASDILNSQVMKLPVS